MLYSDQGWVLYYDQGGVLYYDQGWVRYSDQGWVLYSDQGWVRIIVAPPGRGEGKLEEPLHLTLLFQLRVFINEQSDKET